MLRLLEGGQPDDRETCAGLVREAVAGVVRKQVEAGIDMVTDDGCFPRHECRGFSAIFR